MLFLGNPLSCAPPWAFAIAISFPSPAISYLIADVLGHILDLPDGWNEVNGLDLLLPLCQSFGIYSSTIGLFFVTQRSTLNVKRSMILPTFERAFYRNSWYLYNPLANKTTLMTPCLPWFHEKGGCVLITFLHPFYCFAYDSKERTKKVRMRGVQDCVLPGMRQSSSSAIWSVTYPTLRLPVVLTCTTLASRHCDFLLREYLVLVLN